MSALSQVSTEALRHRIACYPSHIARRGIDYADAGRVEELRVTATQVLAQVRGQRHVLYAAHWTWTGNAWLGHCTCPMARECKHLYAAATQALAPREPAPPDLGELRSARGAWQRAAAVARLLRDRPELAARAHRAPIAQALTERDVDVLCWRVAHIVSELAEGWLPETLEPWRDRPDLALRHREAMESDLLAHLERWSGEGQATPDRSLRFRLGIVKDEASRPALAIEVRLTASRLVDEPRTTAQLEQLLSKSVKSPGRLPAEQVGLLALYLDALRWRARSGGWIGALGAGDHGAVLGQSDLLRLIAAAEGSAPITWAEPRGRNAGARFGIVPGTPVRLAAQPVEIAPAIADKEGALTLDLVVRGKDGLLAPLADVLFIADSRAGAGGTGAGLAVVNGEIHRVVSAPPADVRHRVLGLGGLALDPRRHSRMVGALARRHPDLRVSLAARAMTRVVVPLVALDVRDSDWLQIRLLSVPADLDWDPNDAPPADTAVEEHVPGEGWVPLAEAAPAGDRFELLDDSALAPALEWLARTGARAGGADAPGGAVSPEPDREVGWWLPMRPRRMAAFADAWQTRPAGVRWFCRPSARRLLEAAVRVRPVVRVAASGVDFFAVSAEWEAEGMRLTDEDLERLRTATGAYVRLASGWVRRDDGEDIARQAEALADLGIEAGAAPRRLSVWELSQVPPAALAALEASGAGTGLEREIAALRARIENFGGLAPIAPPPGFVGELRPYQQEGLDFLAHVSSLGLGGVLADDMGLGKTIQALAWLLHLRALDSSLGPALVVCPATVVHNWQREAARFAPGLKVALAVSGAERQALIEGARGIDLVVTNYSLLRRDIEAWKAVPLGVVILDEAQFIKNPDAAVSRAVRELPARHRLALTGTPLENRALDLWSILEFANPGLLGPRKRFSALYDAADAPPTRRRLLAARLRPVLLRRMKSEVARELPPRIEERRDCELKPAQRRLYAAELLAARRDIDAMALNAKELGRHKIEILARLTRLRQICCHPALVGGAGDSGKFDALFELLEPLLAEGQKVLVFSQFVRCLELLKKELVRREIAHHLLTGETKDRPRVVGAFESDPEPCVFLISLRAGGTGLNLTAASYVVLFDPWWNPAVEAQAIDRTHRIGQSRTVIAYRMLARGTLEEKIWELQQKKAALARAVLGEDGFARTLTREDLAYLLAPPDSEE